MLGQVNKFELELLILIAEGTDTNRLLYMKLMGKNGEKVPKSTISRHTTRLLKLKLITRIPESNQRIFELTPIAKNLVSKIASGGGLNFLIRGHNIRFKSTILRMPAGIVAQLEKGAWTAIIHDSWIGYRNSVYGCSVIFTSKSVLFIPPATYGFSAEDCLADAWEIVSEVKSVLEQRYPGLALGTPERTATIVSQHYARPLVPLAIKLYNDEQKFGSKINYNGDRLTLDHSKGFAELESTGVNTATDDLAKTMTFMEDIVKYDVNLSVLLKRIELLERLTGAVRSKANANLPASLIVKKSHSKALSSSFIIQKW